MRPARLAFPILVVAAACSPVQTYRDAARTLSFHLDRVEPSVHLALPLDRSRMAFRVIVGVDNPSKVPFHLSGFTGDLKLETRGAVRSIGRMELARPLELPASGSASMEVEVSFTYGDLRDNWVPIQAAAQGGSGVWHLEGTLKAEAHGIPLQFPVKSNRAFGGAP
jgi:LEA14-like dessication related protein